MFGTNQLMYELGEKKQSVLYGGIADNEIIYFWPDCRPFGDCPILKHCRPAAACWFQNAQKDVYEGCWLI